MEYYEKLLSEAESNSIIDENANLPQDILGYYVETKTDNLILLNKNIRCKKAKICTLAEEIGHYYTTSGDISDQTRIENRKQEFKARRWAVRKLINIDDIIKAFNAGVTNRYELSEFLEVTEKFIKMSIDHFKGIYGHSYNTEGYIIFFNPLSVFKNIE